MKRQTANLFSILLLLRALSTMSLAQDFAKDRAIGQLEVAATFSGPMPTGVTVANDGRIFVNFPKWGDNVDYTVAEVKDGKTVPYPSADINLYKNGDDQSDKLVSVQSVVVDPSGTRLWVLDTGSIGFGTTSLGGPKLIAVDLNTNRVIKKIVFPADVALPTTYLNDVRFDLHRGGEGMAFITDSTSSGPNGIIVVDLATGKNWFGRNRNQPRRENALLLSPHQPASLQRERGRAVGPEQIRCGSRSYREGFGRKRRSRRRPRIRCSGTSLSQRLRAQRNSTAKPESRDRNASTRPACAMAGHFVAGRKRVSLFHRESSRTTGRVPQRSRPAPKAVCAVPGEGRRDENTQIDGRRSALSMITRKVSC